MKIINSKLQYFFYHKLFPKDKISKIKDQIKHIHEFIICFLNGMYEISLLLQNTIYRWNEGLDNINIILIFGQILMIIISYQMKKKHKSEFVVFIFRLYLIMFSLEYAVQRAESHKNYTYFCVFYILLILFIRQSDKPPLIILIYFFIFTYLIIRVIISTFLAESIYTLCISVLFSSLIFKKDESHSSKLKEGDLKNKRETHDEKSLELIQNGDDGKNKFVSSFQIQNNSQAPINNSNYDIDISQNKRLMRHQQMQKSNQSIYLSKDKSQQNPSQNKDSQYSNIILQQIRTGIALIDSNLDLVYTNRYMKRQLCSQNLVIMLEKLLMIEIKKKPKRSEEYQVYLSKSWSKQHLQKEDSFVEQNNVTPYNEQSIRDPMLNSLKSNHNSLFSINAITQYQQNQMHERTHSFHSKNHFQNESINNISDKSRKKSLYSQQKQTSKKVNLYMPQFENKTNGSKVSQSEKLIKEQPQTRKFKSNQNGYEEQPKIDEEDYNFYFKSSSINNGVQNSIVDSFCSHQNNTGERKSNQYNSGRQLHNSLKSALDNLHQLLIPSSILDLFKREEVILKDIVQHIFDSQNRSDKQNCWSCDDLNEKKKVNDIQKQQIEEASQSQSRNNVVYFIENNHLIVNFKENVEEISYQKIRIGFYASKIGSDTLDLFTNGLLMIELFEGNKLSQTIEDHEINEYKNRMLASVSHELRTPLNCSISMLQMLLSKFQDSIYVQNDDEIRDQLVKPALNSNILLLNIINDILDYGQINQGKLELVFSPFSIFDVITECADLIFYQANLKGLSIEISFDGNLPEFVHSDQNRLRQVLLNLLSNSLKFTNEGTIQINTVLESYDTIRIDVSDTGCGIPQENLEKVLEAFGNIKTGKFLNTNGAGLGMSIANNLALGLGGNRPIEIQSKINEGSTFSFYVINRAKNKKGCLYKLKDVFSSKVVKWETLNKLDIQSSNMNSVKMITQGRARSIKSRMHTDLSSFKMDVEHQQIHSQISQGDNPVQDGSTFYNNTNTIVVTYKPKTDSQKNNQSSNFDTNKSKHNVSTKFSQKRSSLHENVDQLQKSELSNEKQQQLQNFDKSQQSYSYLFKSDQQLSLLESCQIVEDMQQDQAVGNVGEIQNKPMKQYFKEIKSILNNGEETPNYHKNRRSIDSILNEDHRAQTDLYDQRNSITIISSSKKTSIKNKSQKTNTGKRISFEKNGPILQSKIISETQNSSSNNIQSIQTSHKYIYNQSSPSLTTIKQENFKVLKSFNSQLKCNCNQILVVDDNDFNIYALQMRLKHYGFNSDKATSGVIAIDKIIQKFNESDCCHNYILIFMDIDMPIKDGYQTTKDIINFYNKMKHPPPKISACTAYVQDSEKIKAYQCGMSYYITKPINQYDLENVLKKVFTNIV